MIPKDNTPLKKLLLVDDDPAFLAYFTSLYQSHPQTLNFDSARQSQIEALRSERRNPSPSGKSEEEDQFGKVVASQNSKFEGDFGITKPYNLAFDICPNLQAAQQKIRSSIYNAYIIDLNLPDGSGLDLIQEIRKKEVIQHPIAVLSGIFKDEKMFKLLKDKYSIDYILDKPIYPQQLDELLVNLCHQKPVENSFKVSSDLEEIKKKYLKTISDKIVLISDLIKSVQKKSDAETMVALKDAVHKIAGSAGTYGFIDTGTLCKELEFHINQQISSNTLSEKEWKDLLDLFFRKIKYSFQFSTPDHRNLLDGDKQFLELLQREVESSHEKTLTLLQSELERGSLNNFKVLILDDDPDICNYISLALTEIGIEVRTIENPLSLYQSLEDYSPNLLFLDLVLPKYDGFDLLKTLRADVIYRDLIIVMITAGSKSETQLNSYSGNADEILYKPLDRKLLQKCVLNLARERP